MLEEAKDSRVQLSELPCQFNFLIYCLNLFTGCCFAQVIGAAVNSPPLLQRHKVFCDSLQRRLVKYISQVLLIPKLCVKPVMTVPTSEHMVAFLGNIIFRLFFLTSWRHAHTQAVTLANTSTSRFAIHTTTKKESEFPHSGFSLHNCKGKEYMKLGP